MEALILLRGVVDPGIRSPVFSKYGLMVSHPVLQIASIWPYRLKLMRLHGLPVRYSKTVFNGIHRG